MLKTPEYNLKNYPNVYEPAEDTFLLIDALEIEMDSIKDLKPMMAVEIGSGSGLVITSLGQILKETCLYFATDVNIEACKATKSTALLNTSQVECINMDLLCAFTPHTFDVILFNPPYVVTDDSEIDGFGINRSWAGGQCGRLIIDQLLPKLCTLLSDNGVCYMLLLKENRPGEIVQVLDGFGMKSKLVLERKIPGEHLFVYKFYKI